MSLNNYAPSDIHVFQEYQSNIIYKDIFSYADLILVPVALIVILLFLSFKRTQQPASLQPYYFKGYGVKLLGLFGFIIFHKYLYGGTPDSFSYYWAGDNLVRLFSTNPKEALQLMFSPLGMFSPEDYPMELSPFIFASNEALVCKISGFLHLISGGSYIVISLLLGLFSFLGSWQMVKVMSRLFPSEEKLIAWCCLFIPSLFFWCSAISKEAICIGALGYLMNASIGLMVFQERIVRNVLLILVMSYFIWFTKSYIVLAFFPSLLLLTLILNINKIKTRLLRFTILPIILIAVLYPAINFYLNSGDLISRFSSDAILEYAKTSYLYLSSNIAESAYNLGNFEPTIGGVLMKAPAAINVALYRPYFWEANKPIVLFACLESTLFLMVTLYVFFKRGLIGFFKAIYKNPIVLFCLLFAIIFSFAVGLTSGNFGTLMRYKIPMMPFYAMALGLIYKRVPFKAENLKKEVN